MFFLARGGSQLRRLRSTMRESYKPKPKTEAPWAGGDASVTLTTTHATSYANFGSPQRRQPIRPKPQHDWTSSAFEGRSTHQDSFTGTYLPPRQSYKPQREYSPERWEMVLTTTAASSYLPHYGNTKREACRPKRTALDTSKFDTRSTSQDAFLGPPQGYRPVAPFYPKEKAREDAPFENTTTSRSAYVAWPVRSSATPPHERASDPADADTCACPRSPMLPLTRVTAWQTKPYVAAEKPKPTMGEGYLG